MGFDDVRCVDKEWRKREMKMIVIHCKLVARLNGILVRMLASLSFFFFFFFIANVRFRVLVLFPGKILLFRGFARD